MTIDATAVSNALRHPANWHDFSGTAVVLGAFAAVGTVAIFLQDPLSLATAIWMALWSGALGAMIGFLFGMPRHTSDSPANAVTAATAAVTALAAANVLTPSTPAAPDSTTLTTSATRVNVGTNLEEVADWLTKILLGAGLTQISNIGTLLLSAAQKMPVSDPKFAAALGPIVLAIWSYFFILGFFMGYLMTRLFLAGALVRAETV